MNLTVDYLKLKNVNAIYCTLNLKKLEIDFTKMIHDILLFIGTNGSCKTYIMSNIHPFAYVGSVDARSGQDMFIEGEDGEKEIRYHTDEGDTYKIRHFYMYQKRGRKLHSYIEKNGVELNKTGLAGTFNDIIEMEFGIDIGFLRVLRLGSNVSNLVNLKSTDRKEFSVKLLTEVEEYLEDDKRSTENARNRKATLRNIVDKMKRLNVTDEIIYQNELDKLENLLSLTVKSKENIIKTFSRFEGEVESSINSTVEELSDEIRLVESQVNGTKTEIDGINMQLGNMTSFVHIGPVEDLIEGYKENLNDTEKKLVKATTKIEMLSKTLVDLKNEGLDLDTKIKSYQELNDIECIETDLDFAYKFDKQYSKFYKDFTPACTKSDVMEDIALMQTVGSLILTAREFSDPARKMYLKHHNNKKDVRIACTNRLIKLSTELSLCTIDKEHEKAVFDSAPAECTMKETCMYYKAFKKTEEYRTVKDIEEDIDVVQQCLKIVDCINNIKILLDSRTKEFPYKVTMENVILDIMNGTITFFDFEQAGKMVTFLETYDSYKSNLEKIEKYEKELEYYKKQQENIDSSIIARRKKVMVEISDTEHELQSAKKKRTKYNDTISELNSWLEELNEYAELIRRLDLANDKLAVYEKEFESQVTKRALLNRYEEEKMAYEEKISSIETLIGNISKEIYNKKVVLTEYRKLKEEQETIESKYEKTLLIQRAVSPKTGIPLLFLNGHMGRARVIANKIIAAVYGDSISLSRFIINEKEFRIPYFKNGTLIEDVVQASQGELAIISLALSFALIEEFSGSFGYNILLLDEVDGPLDKGNKEKFLRVLEAQMERINCKQLFMITHNPLFENYPVDVFVTIDKDKSLDMYRNVNLIN